MSEYVFRYASGYGWKPGEYEHENNMDHYGTLHEEIVRCRDCAYCMAYMAGTYCDYMAHAVTPDGFCAWDKRKEGGE